MTPDALKKRVTEEFNDMGLLKCLDVETSVFGELPRLFEVSHLSMRLVLDNMAAVAAASSIAAQIKRDLERQGVELEYGIRVRWKVVNVYSEAQERCGDYDDMPSETFHAEVESGSAKRDMSIHVSTGARAYIRQYLDQVPPEHRQDTIHTLLKICLNHKLSGRGEYWDPILYASCNVEVQDVAQVVESGVDLEERELIPGG